MKILLFGANGQVGWELRRSLAPLGQVNAFDRQEADFVNPDRLREIIQEYSPDVIVNAAAYTAVDKAEENPDMAYQVNAEAVAILGDEARRLNAWLIHYSTDYVFDGTKNGPYLESDQPNPLSVYGKTKLQGEVAICESGCKYLIFRTSWVYSAHGSNFAKTIFRLANERDALNIVADQVGAPTSAELIADITALALYRLICVANTVQPTEAGPFFPEQAIGIYHLTPMGETSWYGFAKCLLSEAQERGMDLRIGPVDIHPITTAEYPVPAVRPANSRLNSNKLTEVFGVTLPHWQTSIGRLVTALIQQ